MNVYAVVLAAGLGKRMKSKRYKVLHPVCGKPMVGHVVEAMRQIEAEETVVVVGHGAEQVRAYLGDTVKYAMQEKQLGTGHAVMQAEPLLAGKAGTTVVVYGDTPLITADTIGKLLASHRQSRASVTILTAIYDNPHGYGRVVRGAGGGVDKIVEEKDCTPEQRAIREINTGIYCFDNARLWEAIGRLTNDNAQGEYYLTDCIGILQRLGDSVSALAADDAGETIGVNDRVGLSEAEAAMRGRILRKLMLEGVTVIDPSSTYVEADVRVGADTALLPGTMLRGGTTIGEDCVIGPQSDIRDSRIGSGVTVKHSVLTEARVADRAAIGPFAYLRPGAAIGEDAKIGDFVEIKNAVIGDGSKVSHLSYVGDADVGKMVNIGCGAITVNYDGFTKHRTVIEDEAFVGSNVNLIAPVRIGKRGYVVAGSTITHDVGEDDLAIARERQITKPGYAERLRARIKARKK